MTASSTISTVP